MFTDIYVMIQASHVLQAQWMGKPDQTRFAGWAARLRRALAS